ncbi:hypothetical protein HOLleu_41669 [Holothuria leucospilota]|uniref:G-protein coupled receptors family 1 profile domain-containing protein n=1 Tax=Holothuria leucospilota TaxID=206669 RepID=A0A9Q1BCS1_HOLLE|nr:hypothetical protein HOLleu_41669 [Holothuria leucospilota]
MVIKIVTDIRIALCILALLTNGIVLFLQLKLKSFLEISLVFALSLSVADAVYSLGVLLETLAFRHQNDKSISPFLFSAIATAGHFLSYVSVILVAVDRYLSLCAFPIRYKTIVSLKKYYVISGISWIRACAHAFTLRYSFPPGHYFGSLETFITPSIAVIICAVIYLKLYVSTSRSMRRTMGNVDRDEVVRRTKQSRKLLTAIALILFTNCALLIPSRGYNLYLSLKPLRFLYFKNIFWVNIFYNLQTFNSVMNPLIYWRQVLLQDLQLCKGEIRQTNLQNQNVTMQFTD